MAKRANGKIYGSPGVWRCSNCNLTREVFPAELSRKKTVRCRACGGPMLSPEELESDAEFQNRPRGYRCKACGKILTACETADVIAVVLSQHLLMRPDCVQVYVEGDGHLVRVRGMMLAIKETLRYEKTRDPGKPPRWNIIGISPDGQETTFYDLRSKHLADEAIAALR